MIGLWYEYKREGFMYRKCKNKIILGLRRRSRVEGTEVVVGDIGGN